MELVALNLEAKPLICTAWRKLWQSDHGLEHFQKIMMEKVWHMLLKKKKIKKIYNICQPHYILLHQSVLLEILYSNGYDLKEKCASHCFNLSCFVELQKHNNAFHLYRAECPLLIFHLQQSPLIYPRCRGLSRTPLHTSRVLKGTKYISVTNQGSWF